MAANEYRFITNWRVPGRIEDVSDVLSNPLRVVDLRTRGWLPYTLHWQFRVTETHAPHGFSLAAWGDLEGTGVWTLKQEGEIAGVTYDWKIRAEKPLLRHLSFLFKPVFANNHRWAMAKGEASLKAELTRRRGNSH